MWNWFIAAVALVIAGFIIPGIEVTDFWTAVGAVIVIGFINEFVVPFLLFIDFTASILTSALPVFVADSLSLYMAADMVEGLSITSVWDAILGALIISVALMIFGEKEEKDEEEESEFI